MTNDPQTSPRLAWADASRGLSVILIVALHLWAIHLVYWIGDAAVMRVLAEIIDWTSPLRIPLFFFVSGFLAAKSLDRPWRVAWRSRVFSIAYLYVLWVVATSVFVWIDSVARELPVENPFLMMARNLVSPETHLWYLWALIALFVAVWCTRAVPGWVVLAAAGAVSVAAPFLFPQPYLQVASAAVFYVAGARFPAITAVLTSRSRLWIFLGAGALYTGSMLLGPTDPYGLADPLTSSLGVVATIAVIAMASSHRWAGVLVRVGRNTLPVFILNPFVFMLLNDLFLMNLELASWLQEHPTGAAVYTAFVIVATIAVSILFKVGLDRIGMRWMFRLPTRWLPAGTTTRS